MLVTLLIPVTATFLGVALLNETPTLHQLAGAVVIASGLVVVDGRLLARMGEVGWRKRRAQ
jgi:drug/metabolite transporter (DMT)-like permease